MFRVFFGLVAALSLSVCGTADSRVDVFVWDRLYADGVAEKPQEMGKTDREAFLGEMERFEWLEQALLAQRTRRVSSTIGVTDLYTDHTLSVSPAVDMESGDPATLGYFICYLAPAGTIPRAGRISYVYEAEDMDAIREMVGLFFDRNFRQLEIRLGELPNCAQPYSTRIGDRERLREQKEKYK